MLFCTQLTRGYRVPMKLTVSTSTTTPTRNPLLLNSREEELLNVWSSLERSSKTARRLPGSQKCHLLPLPTLARFHTFSVLPQPHPLPGRSVPGSSILKAVTFGNKRRLRKPKETEQGFSDFYTWLSSCYASHPNS